MEEIKYSQEVFTAAFDKEKAMETRTIPFVIAAEVTSGREHRNRFNYNWSNWKLDYFNSNPIVGYQHNVYGDNMCVAPDPDDVIAKAVASMGEYKGMRAIIANATFQPAEQNPKAQKVFEKVIGGYLNATSTGVNPTGKLAMEYFKNEKGETIDHQINFPGQELLEFSIVNIPADANALRRSMKSHTVAALNFLQRSLPELSLADMKGMKVQELLDLFEGQGRRATGADEKQVSDFVIKGSDLVAVLEKSKKELIGADPNVNKYLERLSKIQNRKK